MQGLPTTENSISPYSTDDVCTYEHSTTEESVTRGPLSDVSEEFPIGVGIGVAVGILCIVGTVVVIFVLRRRGILSCKLGTKTAEPDPVYLACASRSNEETVGNHNYCILEKSIQSIRDHADHYNTAEEPKEDNLETDHHNSINDTEEPYQSVKDDYDYTSNAVRTGPDTRKPDAIYNKLKLDRPGDYDHVAGLGYNMSQPGSDYDTSALARTNAGGDDYNHITTAC
ncbi:uncharacterized protein LOC127861291 [Dreissena polymorpha]|uniref:uncharacterized protein LOC127861291 n=1 Tax=Dreissena polymorpha TaxID=45954 RepID=UPI0022641762|nr:uncharacterized protein LOC127861291 [Dreissena polymorpha]